jgi:hypothetical protein
MKGAVHKTPVQTMGSNATPPQADARRRGLRAKSVAMVLRHLVGSV